MEDVEDWLPYTGGSFFFEGVTTVFIDTANPHRGVAEMADAVYGPNGEEIDTMECPDADGVGGR